MWFASAGFAVTLGLAAYIDIADAVRKRGHRRRHPLDARHVIERRYSARGNGEHLLLSGIPSSDTGRE